jgi:hypothetical protein
VVLHESSDPIQPRKTSLIMEAQVTMLLEPAENVAYMMVSEHHTRG